MTKYNQSCKQPVFNFYLQHSKNCSLSWRYFQVSRQTLNRWIKQFNYFITNWLSVFDKNKRILPNLTSRLFKRLRNRNVLQNLPVCISVLPVQG